MSGARVATHVVTPLLVGGLLYIGGRSTDLLMWAWARAMGIEGAALALRAALSPIAASVPEWALFSLPDALWVFALTSAVLLLQRRADPRARAAYLSVPLVLGPGAELAQAAGLLRGTFDVVDLVLCVAAFVLALALGAPARSAGRERLAAA